MLRRRVFELNKDLVAFHWEFQAKFQILTPARRSILKMVAKFESKRTVHNQHKGNSGRLVSVATEANIERAKDHFQENPRTSIKAASQSLNIAIKYASALGTGKSHELLQSPLFPKRITMRCALSSKGVHSVVLRENVN